MTLPPVSPLLASAETHEVINTSRELENYNAYLADPSLRDALAAYGVADQDPALSAFGALTGSAAFIKHGFLANENKPVFHTHDRFGHRTDLVEYHPSYHTLMETSIQHGLHSMPWTDKRPNAHVYRAAHSYLMAQVEAGHGCPITMTFACVPTLLKQPDIAKEWLPKVTARHYDPSNVSWQQKAGLTIGMAMTEKQGGSDVRANTTRAYPMGAGGPGQAYQLVGHKFFMSAPMCDAFLVLAYTDRGLSCFLMPRWCPDGSKNSMFVQRLKNKMGNVSNGSSEVEFRGAFAWLIGEEGRGVANILEMVALTRFDCIIGSASSLRLGTAHAAFHCAHRAAFGKRLIDQPLMRNVLADLAIESDAALHIGLRVGHALDQRNDAQQAAFLRIATAIGKYWVCKRSPGHAYEAMECIGGSGVMENSIMPRLYREAPINTIWEGSGNVQCLDVMRAMAKSPECVDALFEELALTQGHDKRLDALTESIKCGLANTDDFEWRARSVVENMALALQANLLVRHGHATTAEAFIAARLGEEQRGLVYGTLPAGLNTDSIIERAIPGIA